MALPQQIEFQGAAESKGFRPVAQASPTELIKENTDRLLRNQSENFALEKANLDSVGRVQLENNRANFQALAKFSETLSGYLTEDLQRRNESQEEEGLMMAYMDGLPEETMRQFNEQEATLSKVDATTRQVASQVEQEGNDPFVAKQFRDLSGWKAYGYARGMAMQGAAYYPTYYSQAAANAQVVVNGQVVTMSTAKTPAERAAIEAEIRRSFLKTYSGMNPALLNKYLFPQMMAHEARQAAEWGDARATALKEERKAEAKDQLFSYMQAGKGGEGLLDFVNRLAGDFGGVGNARIAAREMLEDGIRSQKITRENVEALLNYTFTARDGSTVRLGDYWGRDFGRLNDLLDEAGRKDLQRELQQQQDQAAEFQLEFNKQAAARGGQRFTDAEIQAFKERYTALGLGTAPSFLDDYQTRQEYDDKRTVEDLLALRKGRGYLTEADLRNVSPQVYQQLSSYVKADEDLAKPDTEVAAKAKAMITSFVNERIQGEAGKLEKSVRWNRTFFDAEAAYASYYRREIRAGRSPTEAHKNAIQDVERNLKVGTYGQEPSASTDQTNLRTFEKASRALRANPNLVNSGVIPGTETALTQARQFADTGRGEIPLVYRQLASMYRGTSAWDIADAQLKASGHRGMMKPPVEQEVDRMDPQVKALLQWRPTVARTQRAALQSTGWGQFLNLIASQESKSYGEYDAMNTGGTANGTIPYGSANSVQVYGRGLSTMTIGEVMALQQRNEVHAAGRYQIIGKTLKGLIANRAAGLTPNDPFNAENQDKLAIVLAKNRIAKGNALSGLRNEWIGLSNVRDDVLQRAIQNITVQSPFNQPENLVPRLIYRIGNRGYGSTGPHLDVKPVLPGETSTSNIPRITMTELDNYLSVGSNRKPLSQGTVTTDNDAAHRRRGSYGHDFAAPDGTPVFADPRVKVVASYKGDGGTDHLIIELPNGKRYQLLHGTRA